MAEILLTLFAVFLILAGCFVIIILNAGIQELRLLLKQQQKDKEE